VFKVTFSGAENIFIVIIIEGFVKRQKTTFYESFKC